MKCGTLTMTFMAASVSGPLLCPSRRTPIIITNPLHHIDDTLLTGPGEQDPGSHDRRKETDLERLTVCGTGSDLKRPTWNIREFSFQIKGGGWRGGSVATNPAALTEDLGLVLGTYTRWLTAASNSSPMGSDALVGLCRQLHAGGAHANREVYAYMKINNIQYIQLGGGGTHP